MKWHNLCDEFIPEGTIYTKNLFQRAEFMRLCVYFYEFQRAEFIYYRGHILCDEIISEGTIYVKNLFQRAQFMQ